MPLTLALTTKSREIAAMRSSLRHSWLENQVLDREASLIAAHHNQHSAARQSFEDKIKPGGDFEKSLQVARTLCETFCASLESTTLIELEPIASLPQDVRSELADMLDELQRKAIDFAAIKSELADSILAAEHSLRAFVAIWNQPVATGQEVAASFAAFQDVARRLHQSLGRVPAGIVLP